VIVMKRRAQVLIMVGIVLALLILSVSVSLYAAGLEYQQYRKSTYNISYKKILARKLRPLGRR